jgi:hypothetical protein
MAQYVKSSCILTRKTNKILVESYQYFSLELQGKYENSVSTPYFSPLFLPSAQPARALRAAKPGTTLVLAPGCHEVSLGEVRVPLRIVGIGAGTPEQRVTVRHRSRLMVRRSLLFLGC